MLNLVEFLSNASGASGAAIRLVLSVFLSYPIALLYNNVSSSLSQTSRKLFFAFFGVVIVLWNYGFDIYHSLLAVAATYLFNLTLTGTSLLVPVSFAYHMGYLLIGYYYTTSESYDIKWTMPHCVLVLRLIGLAFDIGDRQSRIKANKLDDKDFKAFPTILDLFAFTYFPATVLVGPQFTFLRYERYIAGLYDEHTKTAPSYALKRFLQGLTYLIINQVGSMYLPDSYLLGKSFETDPFYKQCLFFAIWGRLTLYKYISIWLLAEGGAVLFGLTYIDAKPGERDYDSNELAGCQNIKVHLFENAKKFGHYIEAFNIQTNKFVANNVYKRLKFLNNRYLSQLGALLFLAVWHGFHSGYYVTFFMEFVIVYFEKQVEPIFQRNENLQKLLKNPLMKILLYIIIRCYTIILSGWCLVPFVFLSFSKWWQIYKAAYFSGWIVFGLGLFVLTPLAKALLPPTAVKKDK